MVTCRTSAESRRIGQDDKRVFQTSCGILPGLLRAAVLLARSSPTGQVFQAAYTDVIGQQLKTPDDP